MPLVEEDQVSHVQSGSDISMGKQADVVDVQDKDNQDAEESEAMTLSVAASSGDMPSTHLEKSPRWYSGASSVL